MDIDTQSVADLARKCRSAFNDCLTHRSLLRNQWAENRLADFSLWAHGVGALAASQASLDTRFQSQPSELTLVKGTLLMLEQFLSQCVHYAESATPVDEATKNVDSVLENLALLAVAIRRTGRQSLEKADRKFDPEDHAELAALLKILCLYQPGVIKSDEELLARPKGLSTEERVLGLESVDLSSAQERLLQTNLRRRNRFLRAQRHSEGLKPPQPAEKEKKEDRIERVEGGTETTTKYEQVDMANQQAAPKTASPAPAEPTISGTSASIPESKLNTQRVKRRSSQVAMTAVTTLTAAARYPRPPKIREGLKMFKCPCCCQTLPVEVAIEGTRWKKHLSEDISPYACLLEDCPTPFATYATEHDWETHVKNKHPPRRLCPFCQNMSTVFLGMEAFVEHVQIEHVEAASGSLMMAVISHSSVVTIGVTHCPLCKSTGPESDPEFIRHILNCMHDFSLRSLPWTDEPPFGSRHVGTYNMGSVKYKDILQWLGGLELGETRKVQLSQFDNNQILPEEKHDEYFVINGYFDLKSAQDSVEALERSSKSFSRQEADMDDVEETVYMPFTYPLPQTKKLWNAATGKALETLEGHSDGVQSVAFSPDGQIVASGSADMTVKLWDATTGKERQTLEGHSDGVQSVAFSPDGQIVASGLADTTVKLWDATTGHNEIVQLLLEKGADVNAQGGDYGTALQAACYQGHNEIVQLLLEKGADVNTQGGDYGTALQAACYQGHNEIVQLLLEKGADVNTQGGYGTALQAACYQGHNKTVQLLLEKGADVNAQGGDYGTALQAACYQGDKEIVQMLLEQRADVNAKGGRYGNAMQAACYQDHGEVVLLLLPLLETGKVDVDSRDTQYGRTPLSWAAENGHEGVVKLLLETGKVDVDSRDTLYGRTPLSWAAENGHEGVVKLLLETGKVDINSRDAPYDRTPLSWAAEKEHETVVRLLLDAGKTGISGQFVATHDV